MSTPETLTLSDKTELQYTPLPALAVADYVESYVDRLETSSVFEDLHMHGYGVDFKKPDVQGLGLLGAALSKLLKGGEGAGKKNLRHEIIHHFKTFKVHAKSPTGEWYALDDEAKINGSGLAFAQLVEAVGKLAGEVLAPLGRLLGLSAEESPTESPEPSPKPTKGS